jgi:hypothetical protein
MPDTFSLDETDDVMFVPPISLRDGRSFGRAIRSPHISHDTSTPPIMIVTAIGLE